MGFGVSGSYLLLGFAFFAAFGTMYAAVSNVGEQVSDSIAAQEADISEQSQTAIEIQSVEYNGTAIILNVSNRGETQLSVNRTDLLINGEYVAAGSVSYDIEGNSETTLWNPGETLQLRIRFDSPTRLKIVTEHGIAATTDISPFFITSNVGYTTSDSLRSVDNGQPVTQYDGTGQAVGPVVENFVSQDVTELPAVTSGGDVVLATASGDRTTLATGGQADSSRLAVGRWQGSDESVFFVDAGTNDITRVTAGGSRVTVTAADAQGIAGIGDFDGDGADELVYGGNSPDGNSNTVNYVDDDGTVVGTGSGYGTSAGIGLGEPGDFDGDGTVRVPVVDGSQNIRLVNDTGGTVTLTSNGPAAKSPMATVNIDGDTEQEIVFVNATGTIQYVDDVLTQNTVVTLTDDQGNTVSADKDSGVA